MGFFRFSMMLSVVHYHLVWRYMSGYLAVFGFFALSGYVITKVSHEIYNNGWKGRGYFLLNRALRLYPVYLCCLLLAVLCMWATNFTTFYYNWEYIFPKQPLGWLVQFTILGQSNFTTERAPERLLLAAWSLSTEIFYYLLIGLITGRSKRLTTGFFIVSCAYALYLYATQHSFRSYYLPIQGTAFVFATGAMAYHYQHRFAFVKKARLLPLLILTNILLYLPNFLLPEGQLPLELFFLYTAGLFFLLPAIEHAPMPAARTRWLNQWLADLTYPVFLLHWAAAALVRYRLFGTYSDHNWPTYFLSLLLCLGVGWLLIRYVERPVKKLRRHFRQQAQAALTAA